MLNHIFRFAFGTAALFTGFSSLAVAQSSSAKASGQLPAWVKDVGARRAPARRRTFVVSVGADATNATQAIQKAIDNCAGAGDETVTFKAGNYVTGALFLKSNVHLRIDQNVTLMASENDADYPSIWTRVAGIEMKWPAALINV